MSREETTTSDYLEQIRKLGINPAKVHRNLEVTKLVSHSVSNGDGKIASTGSLAVKTGKYTGRSPDDRFIVKDNLTNDTVDWGKINHPIAQVDGSHSVGAKNRRVIVAAAIKAKFKVFNARVSPIGSKS